MKKRLEYLDFVRVFSCITIVVSHFATAYRDTSTFLTDLVNSKFTLFTIAAVSIFFFLSGGLLYYHYPKINSLKYYYKKRIKSIYPAFYIAFFTVFLIRVFRNNSFFYKTNCSPITFVLSLLGLDGYFFYAIDNYCILGEWFLGAIILLYLLYPYLLYGFQTSKYIWLLFHTVMLVWAYSDRYFVIEHSRNLLTCVFKFYLGMVLIKYQETYKNFSALLISFAMSGLLVHILYPHISNPILSAFMSEIIIPVVLYIFLVNLGIYTMKLPFFNRIVLFFSGISYHIFLTHHVIITHIHDYYPHNTNCKKFTAFVMIIVLTLAFSVLLKEITALFLRSSFCAALKHGFSSRKESLET